MKSIYHSDSNSMREQPDREKPEVHPSECDPDSLPYKLWSQAWAEYNAHIASLRTIPCNDQFKAIMKDGHVYEEGVDYKLHSDFPPDEFIAVPLQPASEEKQYGYWQLCPKCDGEGTLQEPQYDGATVTFGGTCHVCKGDKLLARPVIDNNEKV